MHQRHCPMTSGRTVLWRTIPILFVSPVVSTFANNYDLAIYLSVEYAFLSLLLVQYRRLCHEWVRWADEIPKLSEKDVIQWYKSRVDERTLSDDTKESSVNLANRSDDAENLAQLAAGAMRLALETYQGRPTRLRSEDRGYDAIVERVAAGMPYIDWLLRRGEPSGRIPPRFSASWFAQLSQKSKQHQQMVQGLKEHSIFMLFRYARCDVSHS